MTSFPLVISVALDRFLVVFFLRRFSSLRVRVCLMIAASWCFGVVVAFCSLTQFRTNLNYNHSTRDCALPFDDDFFRIVCVALYFGFTIPSLIICYVAISFRLWKDGRRLRNCQLAGLNMRTRPSTTATCEGSCVLSVSFVYCPQYFNCIIHSLTTLSSCGIRLAKKTLFETKSRK